MTSSTTPHVIITGVAAAIVLLAATVALAAERTPTAADGAPGPTVLERLTATGPVVDGPVLIAVSGGVEPPVAERLANLPQVHTSTVVAGDRIELVRSTDAAGSPVDAPEDGFRIPLDAIAVDPVVYGDLVPAADVPALAELGPDEALLTASSAELRGLGEGATLHLATGAAVRVVGVVPDEPFGVAELVVSPDTAEAVGIDTDRSLVVSHLGNEAALREAAGLAVGGPHTIHVPGDGTNFRHGGTVQSMLEVKQRFGEFSYSPGADRSFTMDPDFDERHLAQRKVPIVGVVKCHAEFLDVLEAALTEVVEAGLAAEIDPGDYAGCYGPRFMSPGGAVSKHAWGIAVDFNATTNQMGAQSTLHPEVVEIFKRHGFAWGGDWSFTDPMHFEWDGGW